MARGWLTLWLLALASCKALPPGAECRSLDGRALFSPPLEPAVQARREADLAQAEAQWRAEPRDREAVIWYARRLGYVGRYREAVDVLTKALDDRAGDPFLLRHRGHRWITLRAFAQAEHDLSAAAAACRLVRDEVEPDGQPVPGRPPHSSLHYNVHYHLGLAAFLASNFDTAERAWLCCLAVAANDEARVAVTHWLWSVRMRMGDVAGAAAVVAPITPKMDVLENRGYHQLCLLYGGKVLRDAIPVPEGSAGAALRFGLAHRDLVMGDREGARRQLELLAADPGWASFGVIAAEVELARW